MAELALELRHDLAHHARDGTVAARLGLGALEFLRQRAAYVVGIEHAFHGREGIEEAVIAEREAMTARVAAVAAAFQLVEQEQPQVAAGDLDEATLAVFIDVVDSQVVIDRPGEREQSLDATGRITIETKACGDCRGGLVELAGTRSKLFDPTCHSIPRLAIAIAYRNALRST
ncbi:MAG: hypothetical protein OXT09_20495 [Myxococcales bacterium]|nr:hypothetical protein [Myxococcales bacterium]